MTPYGTLSNDKGLPSLDKYAIAGCLSGAISTCIFHPIDVLKVHRLF